MESRSSNLADQKRKIFEYIEVNGPSLPVRISSQFKRDSLIISAFLSELLSDRELKITNLRVGNSPLYYIKGQEFQLENFSQYLGSKEREAFELLKEKKVLVDEEMLPAIRVALRSIKDFAFPIEYNGRLYWRYLKLSDQNAIDIIESNGEKVEEERSWEEVKSVKNRAEDVENEVEEVVEQKQKVSDDELQKQKVSQEVSEPKQLVERGLETQEVEEKPRVYGSEVGIRQTEFIEKPVEVEKNNEGKDREVVEQEDKEEKPLLEIKKSRRSGVKEKSDFVFDVEEFLEKQDFILEKEIDFKKKEYSAYVKIDSQLGKIKMLCIAKDKKSINDNDLNIALNKTNEEKLPVLLISRGEPNKKALERLEEIGNLVFWKVLG